MNEKTKSVLKEFGQDVLLEVLVTVGKKIVEVATILREEKKDEPKE